MNKELKVRKVKEGDIVYELNDTVYLAPENVNEAYYLGRIMEFVKDQNGAITQAKIAWYFRPKDILGKKKSFHPRLLLATMHYDINPISSIRGKCIIKHSSLIDDLEAYKQREDTFYYNKLYDRYSQRLYDVIPIEHIRNLSDTLIQAFYPYKFIVVDEGKASDFVEKRECTICSNWVDNEVLLDCLHCHRKFHMYCIDPPLTKKPPKGYGWVCPECLSAIADFEQESENEDTTGMKLDEFRSYPVKVSKNVNKKLEEIVQKAKEQREREKNEPPPKRNLIPPNADKFEEPKWPYIYFGDISRRESFLTDNIDPTDIYPKTCSRIGKKYQSDIPDLLTPEEIEEQKQINIDKEIEKYDASLENESQERNYGNSKNKGKKKRPKFKEETPVVLRGSKYELVYSKPDEWKDEKVNKYVKDIKEYHQEIKNMDLFDRALLELHKSKYDIDKSLSIMRNITLKDLDLPTWSKTEIEQFENAIMKYGHELQYVKQEVPTKRRKDIVQYFYIWKKTPRYKSIYYQFCKVHRPGKIFSDIEKRKNFGNNENMDNELHNENKIENENKLIEIKKKDNSSNNKNINKNNNKKDEEEKIYEEILCSNCHIQITPDENSISQTMCEECLIYWLKYYTPRIISDKKNKDNVKFKRKREEEKIKLKKRNNKKIKSQLLSENELSNSENSVKNKNDSIINTKEQDEYVIPCSICFDNINTHWNPIVQCSMCNLRVHKYCYGILDNKIANWRCSRCVHKNDTHSSMNYTCVLCNIKKRNEEDAVKLTISNNWAHVLCSLFIPEIKYGSAKIMEPIECINLIDEKKWKKKCMICEKSDGVCVTCHWKGCSKTFHVTCASLNHQKFSIEENGRNGNLYSAIYCSDHTQTLLENGSYSDIKTNDNYKSKNNIEGLKITENIEDFVLYYKQIPNNKSSNNSNIISQIIQEKCKCHYDNSRIMVNSDKQENDLSNNIPIYCKRCNEKISPVWWKKKEFLEMIDELINERFEEEEENKEDNIEKKYSIIKGKIKMECNDLINNFLYSSQLNTNIQSSGHNNNNDDIYKDDNNNNNNDIDNVQQNNIPLTSDKSLYCNKCFWKIRENIINHLMKYDDEYFQNLIN